LYRILVGVGFMAVLVLGFAQVAVPLWFGQPLFPLFRRNRQSETGEKGESHAK
jgi:hypothetical protein